MLETRYVFTVVSLVGNMLFLCGKDALRLSTLTMRTEYLDCLRKISRINTSSVSAQHIDMHLMTDGGGRDCGNIHWTDGDIAAVLSAYSIGLMVAGVAGGPIADAVSGKVLICVTGLISALCTSAIPLLTKVSVYWLVSSQVICGLAGGFVVPCMASLVARWEPSSERGILSTIIYSGSPLSAVFSSVFTGYINMHYDWRIPFLVFGLLQMVWTVPTAFMVYDSPSLHPRISKEEKNMLMNQTKTSKIRPSIKEIPFKRIMLSGAVWGIIVANNAYIWARTHTQILLPQYMEFLGFSMEENGYLSALPLLGCMVIGLIASRLFKFFTNRGLSMSVARKVATTACLLGFGLLNGAVPLLGCNRLLIIIFTNLASSVMGFHLVGAWVASVDISPNYAGTIMGVSSFFMYLTGSIVPNMTPIISLFFDNSQVWSAVFVVGSLVTISCNIVYLVLGTSELQDWNEIRRPSLDGLSTGPADLEDRASYGALEENKALKSTREELSESERRNEESKKHPYVNHIVSLDNNNTLKDSIVRNPM